MSRIVVTGAGGFLGRGVVTELARKSNNQIIAIDLNFGGIEFLKNVRCIQGSIADRAIREEALKDGCDVLIHLATIPGGGAEADPALAKKINLDASMALIEEAVSTSSQKVVFASSIAVFGETSTPINEKTPVAPKLLYGAYKAMMEIWLATASRRGDVNAISLRFPGIVARPRGASAMKSAFMSEVFHAAHNNEHYTAPVSAKATLWLMSRRIAVRNVLHAMQMDINRNPEFCPITLPAVRCCFSYLIQLISQNVGISADFVTYEPDENLEQGFGRLPLLDAWLAEDLGFVSDDGVAALVAATIEDLRNGVA